MKRLGLVAGIIIPIIVLVFFSFGETVQTTRMAACAIMMSIFWVTEAMPLAATALLPLTLFPILGIASSKATATQYMNSTVFLLIGGFIIALSMQRWNLHKRIALNVLVLFGGQPVRLVLGFMFATAGLSMWISNTATTLMMLPIALAVISRYESFLTEKQAHRFTLGLLLSIAYSASIGGMMTLVGTAPNLVFAQFYQQINVESIGFAQWMMIAVPIGLSILLILFILLSVIFLRGLPSSNELKQLVSTEKLQLGNMSYAEKVVLIVFISTALMWVTRKGIEVGDFSIPGWSVFLTYGAMIDDGTVAIAMASILFFIPVSDAKGEKTTILDKNVFSEIPWSIVLLFGGGFALAYGFSESGLSAYLAQQLQGLKTVSLPVLILIVSVGMNLLTELTSNTATTQLVMPILVSTAKVMEITPIWLMLPAALSASCAFMFPVATPPNAIIFGSGKIRVFEMVKVGFVVNAVSIFIITTISYSLIPIIIR